MVVKEYYTSHKTMERLAKEHGVTKSAVYKWTKRYKSEFASDIVVRQDIRTFDSVINAEPVVKNKEFTPAQMEQRILELEAQLKQAEGALARDAALLKNARTDLVRYQKLIREQSVSTQQLQNQESLVGQYEGAVLTDEGNIAAAKLQIEYCRITAPVTGRVGLRRVDPGNMIHASDASGITVITQTRPIQVVFTLVEKEIPDVLRAVRKAGKATPPEKLPVEVWGQDGKELIATGELLTLDNQIDTATGTVKAKAVFDNVDEALFPNQFVNARLRVRVLRQALVIPVSAVQRDNKGAFVYTVNATRAAQVRQVTTGYVSGADTVVEQGLAPGDTVVTDGVDRLRQGTPVKYGK